MRLNIHPNSNTKTIALFYGVADSYIYDLSTGTTTPQPGTNLFLPIDIDTEYQSQTISVNRGVNGRICTNLTVQLKGVFEEDSLIFAHPDIADIARHPVFKHGCVVLDYLEAKGYQVSMKRVGWSAYTETPWIQIDLYAYFAIAELFRIFNFKENYIWDIEHLCTSTNEKQGIITQQRRLRTHHRLAGRFNNYIEMPWILNLNGHDYRVRLSIFDTSAAHGVASYKDFCNNAGIELKYKDMFSNEEKAEMLRMYLERPEDFDNYAKGDLYNHKALLANSEKFKQIYNNLNLEKYFSVPRLTIGATVARLFESAINKLFNAEPNRKDFINGFCKRGSADYLKRNRLSYAAYNLKVDGGRCRNNRPTDTFINGTLADIDIDGCYGNGLRVQTYPLGVPVTIAGEIDDETYIRPTLREFLHNHNKELVPGLWQARVSCKPNYILKYQQDYLVSWLPPKDLSRMPTDTDMETTDDWWDVDNVGTTKIFNHEVQHAIITHDFIQWLENVASQKQRLEMLDNLLIDTAMWYPASERVESIEDLLIAHQNHDGVSRTFIKKTDKKTTKVTVHQECHKWYGVNLGDLLISELLLERAKHEKKTPMNVLIKLTINTIYGIMVSPFFTVGNVVVGNNITARARSLAWCMEKGLHGWQSITDGCAFDLNRVTYPREGSRINGVNVVDFYHGNAYQRHGLKPLGDVDKIELVLCEEKQNQPCLRIIKDETQTLLTSKESLNWIDENVTLHLQNLFSGLDVLHQRSSNVYGNERIGQFNFETKGIFNIATFHGSANYSLGINNEFKYAMRSYSKKKHVLIGLDNDEIKILNDNVQPGSTFLDSLQNPEEIERGEVFLKERILKIGDYRNNHESRWDGGDVYPGCTIEIASLLREFSLAQFTFKTIEQFKSWQQEYQRLLKKYGHSYEMFFLNADGTLNFDRMVRTIDRKILNGRANFFDGLEPRQKALYTAIADHPTFDAYKKTQGMLKARYAGMAIAEADDTYESEFDAMDQDD